MCEETLFLDELIAFLMSMLPVVELRGGIIYAAAKGIPFLTAFVICFLGNILPVPFILLFLRKVFAFLENFRYTKRIVRGLEGRARKKQGLIQKYRLPGLFLLVAIPLPGTGAWTGALVSVLLDIQIKKAFPAIALGVLAADIIMSILSFWIPGLFF